MLTITPAELLTLVIQYAELKDRPIDQETINDVILLLVQCGRSIADYREDLLTKERM